VPEARLHLARMRHPALAHERQHVSGPAGEHEVSVGGAAVTTRVQVGAQSAGDEAVGMEPILVDVERRIVPVEVTDPIAAHPLPQDQVLRPGRRPDRVGLHELDVRERRGEGAGSAGQRPPDSLTAQPPERRHRANVDRPAGHFGPGLVSSP
jgi:hypothetical protein